MRLDGVRELVDDAGIGLALLEHPFYQRWTRGELAAEELAAYAEQYRSFESLLPGLLERISGAVADPAAGALVARNLIDEAGGPTTHVELFEGFAAAVGARRHCPPTPATAALVATYEDAVDRHPAAGLAAIAAYENQASAIAATKAASLRDHYALTPDAVAFWDVHAGLEADHTAWALEAIALLDADEPTVSGGARGASEAWWSFLDEREHLGVGH